MTIARGVGLQCDVEGIFDQSRKPRVLKQIKQTVQTLVENKKDKGIAFDGMYTNGWLLKATVVSLDLNDEVTPCTLEVKASMEGIPLFGTANGFKAVEHFNTSGISQKKLDQEALNLVDGVIEALMIKQALPHILNGPSRPNALPTRG